MADDAPVDAAAAEAAPQEAAAGVTADAAAPAAEPSAEAEAGSAPAADAAAATTDADDATGAGDAPQDVSTPRSDGSNDDTANDAAGEGEAEAGTGAAEGGPGEAEPAAPAAPVIQTGFGMEAGNWMFVSTADGNGVLLAHNKTTGVMTVRLNRAPAPPAPPAPEAEAGAGEGEGEDGSAPGDEAGSSAADAEADAGEAGEATGDAGAAEAKGAAGEGEGSGDADGEGEAEAGAAAEPESLDREYPASAVKKRYTLESTEAFNVGKFVARKGAKAKKAKKWQLAVSQYNQSLNYFRTVKADEVSAATKLDCADRIIKVYVEMAMCFTTGKKYKAAEEMASHALSLNRTNKFPKTNVRAFYTRGKARLGARKYQLAIDDVDNALSLDVDDPQYNKSLHALRESAVKQMAKSKKAEKRMAKKMMGKKVKSPKAKAAAAAPAKAAPTKAGAVGGAPTTAAVVADDVGAGAGASSGSGATPARSSLHSPDGQRGAKKSVAFADEAGKDEAKEVAASSGVGKLAIGAMIGVGLLVLTGWFLTRRR